MLHFMTDCYGLYNDTMYALMEVEFFRCLFVLAFFLVCGCVFKAAKKMAKKM